MLDPKNMVATIQFDNEVAHVRPASHESVSPEQLAEHLRAALEQPLGYPSLSEATVPGDEVVVALEHGLPLVPQILTGTSAALRDAGIEPSQTTFLFSREPTQSGDELDQWAPESGVRLERH